MEEKKYINESDIIVIANSAGPDSMCAMDLITKKYNKNKIIIAHVNHNIRKESKEEEKFLKEYIGDKYIFETTTLYENNHSEENLRNKRYQFFEQVIRKYQATVLITAHHGDDLIETILMRMTRGSSLNGYSAIKEFINKNNYKLYRPLIKWSKDDIICYNEENNIPYKLDKSNDDNIYTRNRFRNNIIPILKDENQYVHQKFYEFANEISDANDYIEEKTNQEFKFNIKGFEYNLTNFEKLHKIIQQKIIEKYLLKLYQERIVLVKRTHTNAILNMIKSKNNQEINLPLNITLEKEYNILRIKKEYKKIEYKYIFDDHQEVIDKYEFTKINNSEEKNNYYIRLNSKEITLPLIIRNWKNNDVIEVKNLKGHKKIKKIFSNEKIMLEEKINYPVLTDSQNQVLWLPGIKKSKFDNEKNQNYDIIIKCQLINGEKER